MRTFPLAWILLALSSAQALGADVYRGVCVGKDDVSESTVFYARFLSSAGLRYENTSYYHAVDAVLADQARKLCRDGFKGSETQTPYQKLEAILDVQFDTCRGACHRLAPQFSIHRSEEMAEECASVCSATLDDRKIAAARLGPQKEASRAVASEKSN